jgi:thioredoxin-related protein
MDFARRNEWANASFISQQTSKMTVSLNPKHFQMRLFGLLLFLTFTGGEMHAQPGPATANQIMKVALQEARVEKKKVFIFFSASWCGWCHAMDSALQDSRCKDLFGAYYVIRKLDVKEEANKKYLENPGATEMLRQYHGENQGIPFWLIFDEDGKLIADSQLRNSGESLDRPGENVGCPSTQKEIQYFAMILKQTSHLTSQELEVIEARFAKTHD